MSNCLLEKLDRMLAAETLEELWEIHVGHMQRFGFDRLLYGFTRFKTGRSLGQPDDILVLSNHDPCYIETFIRGGMYERAPMVRWAAENVGVCSWNWIRDNYDHLCPEEREVVEFNLKHGIVSGYTISFPETSRRNKGAIGLTGRLGVMSQTRVEEVWAEHGCKIKVLNEVFHLKVTSLPYTGANPLTQRQQEVLEWVGDGKTVQDIGVILGLKPATVEKHLRLAREALDVDTTAQAVLTASFKNQIFVHRHR